MGHSSAVRMNPPQLHVGTGLHLSNVYVHLVPSYLIDLPDSFIDHIVFDSVLRHGCYSVFAVLIVKYTMYTEST